MIRKIINRLLEKRYFWRTVDFAEIAELYASRMLRTMAVSMVSVFVAIYLYQNGYRLSFIMVYFTGYFLLRALLVFPAAFTIAHIGPKHAAMISNILYVPALLVLSQLHEYGLIALAAFGLFQAASVSLYDVSHLVNFSKIRNVDHVGKELSFMYIFERVGTSLSPVIGGLVAFWFGPQATMLLAAVIFGTAALPLFFTPEPTRTRQKITFHGINWRAIRRGLLANAAIGADTAITGSVWSLYISIVIFGTTSNAVYAQVGAVLSVTVVAALVFSRLYGLLIDRRRGGDLLKVGVVADALTHFARPFVATPLGVVMTNVANEAATTGYSMPFAKGVFDQADNLPGYRIVYMSLMAIVAPLGAALMSLVVVGLGLFFSEVHSMQISFIVIAWVVLLIGTHRFPALQRNG